jgi:hypothetical protein
MDRITKFRLSASRLWSHAFIWVSRFAKDVPSNALTRTVNGQKTDGSFFGGLQVSGLVKLTATSAKRAFYHSRSRL